MKTKHKPLTSKQKQSRRRSALDAIAREAGWPSWSTYATEVKWGSVRIVAAGGWSGSIAEL